MYINWQTYDVLLLNPSLLCFDCHTTITHAYQINRDNIDTTNMTTSKCLQNLSTQIPIANDTNKSTPIILACHVSSLPSSRLCNNFLSPAASHKPKSKANQNNKKKLLKCQNQNKQTKKSGIWINNCPNHSTLSASQTANIVRDQIFRYCAFTQQNMHTNTYKTKSIKHIELTNCEFKKNSECTHASV